MIAFFLKFPCVCVIALILNLSGQVTECASLSKRFKKWPILCLLNFNERRIICLHY